MPNKVRVHIRIRVGVCYLKPYPCITLLIWMSVEWHIMQRDEHPTLTVLDRFETARGEGLRDFVDGRLNIRRHTRVLAQELSSSAMAWNRLSCVIVTSSSSPIGLFGWWCRNR